MKHVHSFGDDALGDLDAVGVARAIASKQASALEMLDAALARIDAVNPTLAAIAEDDRERARARAASNSFSGAFAGVPSAIKSNTAVAGLPTRYGSAATSAEPAAADAPFTGEFVGTGVNVLGTTTMPPFGLSASTEFDDREPTRNPWDTDRSSGGSSGGAAALVAAGALPIAHGNDGGGSIRIPAAACGLVGLKPTRGRTAADPLAAKAPIDLVCNGVLTRSVRDSAYFLADLERQRPVDGLEPVGLVQGPGERRLRIALIAEPITGQLLEPDTNRVLMATVDLLEALGHRVETVPLPVERSYVDQFALYWALMAFSMDRFGARTVGAGFDRSRVDPFTRGLSRRFTRRFYKTPSALRGLRTSTGRMRELLAAYDLVLSPTLSHSAPEIGYLDPSADFDEVFDRLTRYVSFTPPNNTSGAPAISLPLGSTADGRPIGMHFSADLGGERALLEIAYELEAAQPFARIQDAGAQS